MCYLKRFGRRDSFYEALFTLRSSQQSRLGIYKMGRGRGKGKKQMAVANEYSGSGSDNPHPASERKGKLHEKPMKDDKNDGETLENEDANDINHTMSDNEEQILENGKKRKRYLQLQGNSDVLFNESCSIVSAKTEDTAKTNGFRHSRSRRKNKPCRAAEAGILYMGL